MRSLHLTVPSPALPERIDRFLAANLPELSRKTVKKLVDAGQVRVDGRTVSKAGLLLRPGQIVDLDYRPSQVRPPTLEPRHVVARGPGWIAVDKPPGVSSHRSDEGQEGVPELLACVLGAEAPTLRPAHRLDKDTSGLLVLASDSATLAALADLFATRAVEKTYRAVVHPAPTDEAGTLEGPGDMHARWSLLARSPDGSRAELAVQPRQGRTHQVRIQLAAAGWPIIGDLEHGRPVPGGAPRMALHSERLAWGDVALACPPPDGWTRLLTPSTTPDPPRPERRRSLPSAARRRTLKVSRATARIVRSGHPWVIRDADTGDLGLFAPGDLADLVDPAGAFVATALVDPRRSLCARVVADKPDVRLDDDEFERRATRALRRRSELLEDPDTTALRLIHGEADGLPGLRVDLWGDQVVATRSTDATGTFDRVVYRVLAEQLGAPPLWEQDHFEDLRRRADGPGGARLPGRWIQPPPVEPPDTALVREDGLLFEAEPRAGLTTGLYPDQRDNRRLLRGLLAEGPEAPRVANLFAHTGAFTVACAAAGAQEVVSVDLSPKYLERARRNLVLNGLEPARHPTVAADALSWLQRAPRLDGAILDPPAHARGRGKGVDWSARRDYRALVEAAAQRLVPGGWLLCIVNLKGLPRDWLRRQLEAGLRGAGRALDRTGPAPPAADHPRRRGFPEGTPFQGIVAWTR